MKIKFMVAATLMAALVTTTSCGNSNKQSQSEKTEQAAPAALSIDNLLVHADSLANKEVTIEGICTHTCKHGATKIFLMGSDDTKRFVWKPDLWARLIPNASTLLSQ